MLKYKQLKIKSLKIRIKKLKCNLKKHKKCPKTWKISRVCKFIKK